MIHLKDDQTGTKTTIYKSAKMNTEIMQEVIESDPKKNLTRSYGLLYNNLKGLADTKKSDQVNPSYQQIPGKRSGQPY